MKNLLRYASLLFAAAMLFACTKPGGDEILEGDLVVKADKSIIKTFDGDYATLTVTVGDVVVTDGVTFYDDKQNVLPISDFKFTAAKAGEHKIIASYGTQFSKELVIYAVSVEIPETPADPNPGSTDFKTRVLVVEHTGTNCGYCPPMKTLVHEAMADEAFADRMVLTTCHTFNESDPAYFNEKAFMTFNGVSGHPYIYMDSYLSFNDYRKTPDYFKSLVNGLYDAKDGAAAGIAVNSVLTDNEVVIKASVKAAETGSYRVGAYLLEDGIKGNQISATADWMHIHDGVISNVDAKYFSNSGAARYYGHSIGEIEKGKTGEYVFVWDLDAIQNARQIGCSREDFVRENLRLAVFTTTIGKDANGREFYYVNNVIECPIDGQTPYEYK